MIKQRRAEVSLGPIAQKCDHSALGSEFLGQLQRRSHIRTLGRSDEQAKIAMQAFGHGHRILAADFHLAIQRRSL